MLDRKEIEKRLQGVDPQLCVAFAARCSLRVLPLLVANKDDEAFGYWHKEKCGDYLLALLTAQQASINFSAFGRKINIVTAAAAATATATAATAAAADAAYAAYATATAADAADAAYAADAADAAAAAAAAAAANTNLEFIILLDLEAITSNKSLNAQDFLYSPLWKDSPPPAWHALSQHFTQALVEWDSSFSIWADWYQDRLKGVPLDDQQEQQWLNVAEEIRAQGAKAVNNYLATLSVEQDNASLKPLNLVRALFIGNGAAGKTSLIRKLHGEQVVEGEEEMTPGIEIRQWSLPNSDIKARFWDFGGQVMTHAMHQFFLHARCLYVLVVDAGSEREIREHYSANQQAEYWLEHIKAFGNSAPVMLVGNKSDQAKINLNMNALREKYPNIIDFFPLSCVSEETACHYDFKKFQTVLIEQLKQVGTHQMLFTENQFTMLEQIRSRSRQQAFLSEDTFNALCKKYDIGKHGLDQQAFLGLLGALGEVVHFPEREWSTMYVLNPRWLTYGVYALLYSNEAKIQQGTLSYIDVQHILQAKQVVDEQGDVLTYPTDKYRYIIDAMAQFKLCYRLENDEESHYVIPDKLPEEQPDLTAYFNKKAAGTLAFEFAFTGLLPRTIMPNLIVSRHYEIVKDQQGRQLVWQYGVVIYNTTHQASARWQVDYRQQTVQLWVQGENAREYLVILRDKIHEIFNTIKGLSPREYVLLPESARLHNGDLFQHRSNTEIEKAPYDRLLKEAKRGQAITSSDSGADYDVQKVMGFIMTEEQQIKEQQKIMPVGDVYNTTYQIDSAEVVGGVGRDHQTTQEKTNPTDDSPDTPAPKWYQQWGVITVIVAIVAGVLMGWGFSSVMMGALTSIIAGFVFYSFNPKRRFLRAAWFVLGTASVSALPAISVKAGLNPALLNEKFGFLFNWGEPANPWLIVPLVVLAGFLFFLDDKQA